VVSSAPQQSDFNKFGTADDFNMLIGMGQPWGTQKNHHVSSFLLTIHVEIGGSEQIDWGGASNQPNKNAISTTKICDVKRFVVSD
jgi:hypothetical protein